jgi:hypothetical protein
MDRLVDGVRAGSVVTLSESLPDDVGELGNVESPVDVEASVVRDLLRGKTVADPDPRGVWLRGARIRGRLDLDYVDAVCPLVLQECLLESGISLVGAHLPALTLRGCRISHPGAPAVAGRGVRVEGAFTLRGSTVRGAAGEGAVVLIGALIGGDLDCRGVVLSNSAGAAMEADRAQIGNNVLFEDDVLADGVGERGTLRLTGARIGGRFGLRDATLRNPDGPVVSAVDLHTVHGVFLEGRFRAEGAGRRGTIYLRGAHLGGEFNCRGAQVTNTSGPAVLADGITVDRVVFLNDGFRAQGQGWGGAVRMMSARVAGRVNCRGAHLSNPSGPALAADGIQIAGDLLLGNGFTATGDGDRGTIRLREASVAGVFDAVGAVVESTSSPLHRWMIDGLTYSGVPRWATRDNRDAAQEVLRSATPSYAAQPYQQLAAAYRADGHDMDARAVLMQQRRDQLHRGALTGWRDRSWTRLTGTLLGYGYRPARALAYLVGVLAVSVGLAFGFGVGGALAQTPDPAVPPTATARSTAAAPVGQPCSPLQLVGKGLDLGTPFFPTARSGAGICDVTATPAGDALTAIRWVLQLVAWALAALFIAGFTGIVRRT